jgi:hypothetical protein
MDLHNRTESASKSDLEGFTEIFDPCGLPGVYQSMTTYSGCELNLVLPASHSYSKTIIIGIEEPGQGQAQRNVEERP